MITHPDKVLFPEDGITKGELAAYYEAMAPYMLPHIRGRPLTMERYPSGIGRAGFMQKNVSKGFPEWLQRVELPKRGGFVNYPLLNDARSLLWAANQNAITLHITTARLPDLHHPDLCVFDLDPSEEDPPSLRLAALAVRDLLSELGLVSRAKTSGSKGFHILVSLDGEASFVDASQFGHAAGAVLVKRRPDLFTQEFIKLDRGGRILIDTGRNNPGATFAAPYSVRPKPGAPVSAPCTWQEIEDGAVGPQTFTLRTMAKRLREAGDLWHDMGPAYSLRAPLAELQRLLSTAEWEDALLATRRRPVSRRRQQS